MKKGDTITLEFEEGNGISFEISDVIEEFLIVFHTLDDIELKAASLRSLIEKIRVVMNELEIGYKQFILELVQYSKSSRCTVDKSRETIHLFLPIDVEKEGSIEISDMGVDDENYLLFHELMHAKDIIEYRFPSQGEMDLSLVKFLNGSVWNFSINGRLEKLGKPFRSKEKTLKNEYDCFVDFGEMSGYEIENEAFCYKTFENLCNRTWGHELKSEEVDEIINEELDIKT